jgi:simple sugar transport system ATP-binding protein
VNGRDETPPALELRGIWKRFGSLQALRGADFLLRIGRVHALLGENGAGKSTLMHVAFGMARAERGEILVDGRAVSVHSPRDARARGIGMVHQHFTSVPALTVAENLRLAGDDPAAGTAADDVWSRLREGLDPAARVETLSVAQKQRLEIVKALSGGSRTLLLDEPSAVLAPAEVDELMGLIRALAAEGRSVVLITHKLDEVFSCADDVTVMRHGTVTWTGSLAGQTEASLAAAMIGSAGGRQPETGVAKRTPHVGAEVVRLEAVEIAPFEGRGPGLRRATCAIRAGEMVGVAAIEGNGHRELMLGVAGLLPVKKGRLAVAGRVALVPEDRSTEGLVPSLSLTENLVLAHGPDAAWIRGPWVDWRAARRRVAELLPAFDVRAQSPDVHAGSLSGGNQQKLVLAGALEGRPQVLVVENPTRGLDIVATGAIHQRLKDAAAGGIAVLVYSSDLDEVLELAERVFVVARGVLREMQPRAARAAVGEAMLGISGRDSDS